MRLEQAQYRTRHGRSQPVEQWARAGTRGSAPASHLDAVLEQEARRGEALLLVQRLAEDDDLLEQEHPPLSAARQEPRVLVCDQERVLQEQLALGDNFTLK